MEFPKDKGLCTTCDDKGNCPVADLLPAWREILAEYGADVKELKPDLWDEYSIEEPEVIDGKLTWCPMYYQTSARIISHAAYLRNDGVTTRGKSHSDILKICPYGTCKTGSISGFIDSDDRFVDRFEAYQIALRAKQVKLERMKPENREYLLSEDIWSNVSNGDWTYDDGLGYMKKE